MSSKDFDGDNEAIHEEFESIPTNTSGNTPFSDVLAKNISRRGVVKGSLAAAVAAFFVPSAVMADDDDDDDDDDDGKGKKGNLVNFAPVTIDGYAADSNGGKEPVISDDYEYQVLIPWGTPIKPNVPEYTGDPNTRPSAADQADQIGIGHDGMWLFPEVVGEDDDDDDDDRTLSQNETECSASIMSLAEIRMF